VRTRIYITDREDWETVARVHGKFFSLVRPAATMVIVAGLIDPRWKVEIEVDALIPGLITAQSASSPARLARIVLK